jgi:hypothetical protein
MKAYGILFVGFLIVSSSCNVFNSEDKLSDKLVGIWDHSFFEDESQNISIVYRYGFQDIDNYTITEVHYSSNGEFIGFRQFNEGSYTLTGNKLVMELEKAYFAPDGQLYESIETLKKEESRTDFSKREYRTEFENKNTRVTLFFDCPPNAFCTEPPVLNKVPVIYN